MYVVFAIVAFYQGPLPSDAGPSFLSVAACIHNNGATVHAETYQVLHVPRSIHTPLNVSEA